jgi:hypothetical protein
MSSLDILAQLTKRGDFDGSHHDMITYFACIAVMCHTTCICMHAQTHVAPKALGCCMRS